MATFRGRQYCRLYLGGWGTGVQEFAAGGSVSFQVGTNVAQIQGTQVEINHAFNAFEAKPSYVEVDLDGATPTRSCKDLADGVFLSASAIFSTSTGQDFRCH